MAEKEVKLTPSERRNAKRRETIAKGEALAGTGRGSKEPTLNPLDYTASLMSALNYYTVSTDCKQKKKWTIAYLGKGKTNGIEDLPDYEFHSIGAIIRLKSNGQALQEKEEAFIDKRLSELYDLVKNGNRLSVIKVKPVEQPAKVVVSIQERIALKASEVAGEFDGMIDDYVVNDKEPDFAAYLKANNISSQVSKLIPKFYDRIIAELEEVIEGSDKQLVEGYSNFTKVKIRRLKKIYESIGPICDQQVVSAKAERKPRVRKEKPAAIVAAKVKYMKESTELGIKSENPTKIVGSSEVWIYNTKYKKLQAYRAEGDGKLTVKGTTIVGYSVAESSSKTLRKPETVKDYVAMTKRTFATAFKGLKTKEAAVNGRINEDCVILKVL